MIQDFWVDKFYKEIYPLLVAKLSPQKVLLFGSRAKGTASESSDIDVIIVSEFFKTIPKLNRMTFLLKQFRFNKHIDFLCYTPEEYEKIKNNSSIVIDALENSITIS
ncbi:MAG: nucleotidyltransferase domain-containing protein [Bacteroidota bacterium]